MRRHQLPSELDYRVHVAELGSPLTGRELRRSARAHRTLDRRNVEGQGGRGGPE